MKNLFVNVLLLIGNVNFCLGNNFVPVFMWSSDRNREFPQVFAGHFTSKIDFQNKYISKTSENVLLFLQDKISISEILIHGSVYGENNAEDDYEHLKMVMSEYTSSFLPNVESPALVLSQTFEKDDSYNIVHIDVNDLKEKKLFDLLAPLKSGKNLFIVDFSKSQEELKNIDELIGQVVTHMKSSNKLFTAYYTANQNIDLDQTLDGPQLMNRHLLASDSKDDEEKLPISLGNFLFYFDELWIDKAQNISIPLEKVEVEENECNAFSNVSTAINCTIKLNLGETNTYKNMNLDLVIQTSNAINGGYWYVKEAILSFINSANDSSSKEITKASIGRSLVEPTPLGYSYSCYDQEPLFPASSANYSTENVPLLIFVGLQMQVFMVNDKKFGHYNDCVGFFTIGIWMFIICAAILITILLFGVSMLMGINTMDRYDDPKAKSINITAGE